MPSVVIIGADALALRVCEELRETYRAEVTVLWKSDEELARGIEALGSRYVARSRPEGTEALKAAGIPEANIVMLLSTDDRCNVQAALRSRDINPSIRIVLRQYDRRLGRKIEHSLPNCSVVSHSMYAAATYAAAAMLPYCFYALQFPDVNGALVGFSRVRARSAGVYEMPLPEVERRLHAQVIAVEELPKDDDAELILFHSVRPERKNPFHFRASWPRRKAKEILRHIRRFLVHMDPVVRTVLSVALTMFLLASIFFAERMHLSALRSAYFVMATMTTTGYGDVTPPADDPLAVCVAMLLMFSGVILSGTFVAIVASRLTRAQWVSMHGLRPIGRRAHFVVCGAGSVGSCVIDFLLGLGQRVVVIEANPSATIVDRSRDRHFDLLTGDATADTTLELCNLEHAQGLIALTESDTSNLEAALGARAYNPSLPIVMRVMEGGLAVSMARHFGLDRTFGSAALAAPAFASLAFDSEARGHIRIGGVKYTIHERSNAACGPEHYPPASIPVCVWRNGTILPLRNFAKVKAGDQTLFLAPIAG